MELQNARTVSNDFQHLRLYSLHLWPEALKYSDSLARGPYVVLQTAVDPEDPTPSVEEFILSRDGIWTNLTDFYQLPPDLRRAQYLHPTAAAAVLVIQSLTGRPRIHRPNSPHHPFSQTLPPPQDDTLCRAVDATRRRAPQPFPNAAPPDAATPP